MFSFAKSVRGPFGETVPAFALQPGKTTENPDRNRYEFSLEVAPLFIVSTLQGGREISVILVTVVGDDSKDQYIYNRGSKLDSIHRNRCFLFCFDHVVLLIPLEIVRKHLHQ